MQITDRGRSPRSDPPLTDVKIADSRLDERWEGVEEKAPFISSPFTSLFRESKFERATVTQLSRETGEHA